MIIISTGLLPDLILIEILPQIYIREIVIFHYYVDKEIEAPDS